jgi:hypothetical protein
MGKWTVDLSDAGIQGLLKSAEITEAVTEVGKQVQKNAASYSSGTVSASDFTCSTGVGKTRVHCNVGTANKNAVFSNLKHNSLAKALGALKK